MVFPASLHVALYEKESVEENRASSTVVFLGKALNWISLSLSGRLFVPFFGDKN